MARPGKNNPNGEQVKHKFTPENLQKLKEAYGFYANIEEACFYAGISVQTYYNWKAENKKLFEEIEAFRNHPKLKAKNSIVNHLTRDQIWLSNFLKEQIKNLCQKRSKKLKGVQIIL